MILVDSNVFIEILLGSEAGRAAMSRIESLADDEPLAYSAVTWFELCVKEGQQRPARELLDGFQGIPLTLSIAERAAAIYSRHMAKNRRRIPDALIAATALASDAALWTFNRSDFKGIPQLRLLD